MAITRISRAFKDISLSFKRHPVTNDIGVLKNADAIKRSVRNLVQTIPSERFLIQHLDRMYEIVYLKIHPDLLILVLHQL